MHGTCSISKVVNNLKIQTAQINISNLNRTLGISQPRLKTASLDTDYTFEDEESKYHAYFLIKGEEINGNDWGVPDKSIPANIQTFEGRPFLITADEFIENSPYKNRWMHPNINHFKNYLPELVKGLDAESLPDVLKFQDNWKVGDIIKVLYDVSDDYWKAIIKPLPKYEDRQFPPFCSPAVFKEYIFEDDKNIMNWQGVHLAGLMESPAYGSQATYEGSCNGTLGTCTKHFSDSQSIFETQLKLSQSKIAAVLSTDNPVVNVVPIHGEKKKKKRKP